jgi:multiple sugar transport system substrate-binding protein
MSIARHRPRDGSSGSQPPRRGLRKRLQRRAALATGAVLAVTPLAACGSDMFYGSEGGGGDTPTLVWYINPDVSNTEAYVYNPETGKNDIPGGQAYLAEQCAEASGGAYDIEVKLLPNDASDQREQLIRRLAAEDDGIDLMSLDPPFIPEAANAGFLSQPPEELVGPLTEGVFEAAVEQSSFDGQLWSAPFRANTQLLFYKKSVAEEAGLLEQLEADEPVTWDQIIEAAQETGTTVSVHGKRYEGYAVWINALIAGVPKTDDPSEPSTIVDDTDAGRDATVNVDDEAGTDAARIIQKLVDSGVASPDLSVAIEPNVVASFVTNEGGFLVNWPYTYSTPEAAGLVEADDLGFTRYPQTVEGAESHPPLGGISIAVSAFSSHEELAWQAAECLTNEESQIAYMLNAGEPTARTAVYEDPDVQERFGPELTAMIQESIEAAAPRPSTPYWTDISGALVDRFHPESSVDADSTPEEAHDYIVDVLHGDALLK